MSHPTRGEWIEILNTNSPTGGDPRLTPHGVSGLKFLCTNIAANCLGLTPHGVSGLKFFAFEYSFSKSTVSPHTG